MSIEHITGSRRTLGIGIIVISILTGTGLVGTRFDNSIDRLVSHDDAVYRQWQHAHELFDFSEEQIAVIYSPGDIFSPSSMAGIRDFADAAAQIPGVKKVRSIVSARGLTGESDGFDHSPLVPAGDYDETAASKARRRARITHQHVGLLYSEDLKTAAILLEIADQLPTAEARNLLINETRRLSRQILGGDAFLVGVPIMANDLTNIVLKDFVALLIASIVIVFLALRAYVGSWWTAAKLLIPGLLSCTWVFGLMGWLRISICAISAMMAPITIAVAGSYVVHVHDVVRSRGDRPGSGLLAAVRPVCASAITTALGMLSLLLVDNHAVREFAILGAFAILAAGGLALFVPYFWTHAFTAKNYSGATFRQGVRVAAERLAMVGVQRPVLTLVLWIALSVLLVFLAARVKVGMDNVKGLRAGTSLRVRMERAESMMGGVIFYMGVIEAEPGKELLTTADEITALRAVQSEMESFPGVTHTTSILDFCDGLSAQFDPDGYDSLSPEQLDQALLVFSFLGEDSPVRQYVAPDQEAVMLLLQTTISNSADYQQLKESFVRTAATHFPVRNGFLTGTYGVFSETTDSVALSQRRGLVLACIFCSVLLLVFLQHPYLGLFGLIVNVPPVFAVFAASVLSNNPLNMGNALVACIAIGVAVDDTIHLLVAYDRKWDDLRAGATTDRDILRSKGSSILFTSLLLIAAFMGFSLSVYSFMQSFGAFMVASLAVAILGDLVALPALLRLAARRRLDTGGYGTP